MTIIAGSRLPDNKHVVIGLTSVFGIGRTRAKLVCNKTSINPETKVKDLSSEDVENIRKILSEEGWSLGTTLKRTVQEAIKLKISTRSVQGIRLLLGLPVNGQKTQKNARTARKKKGSNRG